MTVRIITLKLNRKMAKKVWKKQRTQTKFDYSNGIVHGWRWYSSGLFTFPGKCQWANFSPKYAFYQKTIRDRQLEECFRIMKTDFSAKPVYLQDENRIKAHFLICFLALTIYRFLEKKLDSKYTCEELLNTLKSMNFAEI